MIAKIVLNRSAHATDGVYDYIIPQNMKISLGMRVVVPFGFGNKTEEGYVVEIAEKSEFKKLKSIIKTVDDFVYFDEKGVELADFMHHRYFSKLSECIKCLLPPSINTKFKSSYVVSTLNSQINELIKHSLVYEKIIDLLKSNGEMKFEELSSNFKGKNLKTALNELRELGVISEKIYVGQNIKDAEITIVKPFIEKENLYEIADKILKKAPKQAAVLETVCDYNGIYLSELLQICDTTHSTVNALVKKGYLTCEKEVVRAQVVDEFECVEENHVVLTNEQKNIIDTVGDDISTDRYAPYLLHGVTGSGKTEVYLNLIEKCLSCSKNAVFLVPEISLTPQMIRQVVSRFGENVAVLHSSLTLRERYDQWKKIKSGEVQVVVGARSAVFAPFDKFGLLIVDEEHENSYKSELSPKYSTIEIAKFRAKQNGAVLLLASATPSVETYYHAKTGKLKLLELNNRINNAKLPEISVVDMRNELKSGNTSILSRQLKEAISYNLENKLKTILFLNRRGYSGFVQCRSCGHVIECPNCNIAMTYHRNLSSHVCHYCDYKTPLVTVCPKCNSTHIKFGGDGTQKIEEELYSLFPDAKILRMDADTTSSKDAHRKILDEFSKEDSDILIGTQMITKGLDFEKVTLVGVLSADMSLNVDDFRSDEKTFDLITQVCGRAGRGKYSGKAIIQTYDPENETIEFSKTQDYKSFYNREIEVRRLLTYPPFCDIINFIFSSDSEEMAQKSALKFHNMLKEELSVNNKLDYVIAYKVMPAPLQKINGNFRYRFIMKLTYNKEIYNIIAQVGDKYRKDKNIANLVIDTNPYNLS